MALGPTLGTGLFIGAGQALAVGGPASLLISYAFLSLLTYFLTTTAAEVATHSPTRHGTLVANGFRYMTDSMGFAAGILRWTALAMFVPYEITTAMVNLGLWNPGLTIALRMIIITTVVVGTNFLPERYFRTSASLKSKSAHWLVSLPCHCRLALVEQQDIVNGASNTGKSQAPCTNSCFAALWGNSGACSSVSYTAPSLSHLLPKSLSTEPRRLSWIMARSARF